MLFLAVMSFGGIPYIMEGCGQDFRSCMRNMVFPFLLPSSPNPAKLTNSQTGPIIRLGPNEVHIHDLNYFNNLMSFRPLNKHAIMAKQFGITEAIFGTEDYKAYTRKRAAFGDTFSRSSALKLQGLMDVHIEKAVGIMNERWKEGKVVDLA